MGGKWILACLALLLSSVAYAGSDPRDITKEFENTWETIESAFVESQVESLRPFQILMVEGFLSEFSPQARAFHDQIALFESLGLNHARVPIDTTQTVTENARTVARAIHESKLPVILLTFSKGGLDALEALRVHPELAGKVRGWILLQAPLYGSPIAEYVQDNALTGPIADFLLQVLGGDERAIADMKVDERVTYMQANAAYWERLNASLPVIAFAPWKDDEWFSVDTNFELLRNLMYYKDGLDNDGLVPAASAIFPGAEYIALEGLDHTAAVHESRIDFDRVRFTKTVFSILLKRMSARLIF